jgi:hypothetical protein
VTSCSGRVSDVCCDGIELRKKAAVCVKSISEVTSLNYVKARVEVEVQSLSFILIGVR